MAVAVVVGRSADGEPSTTETFDRGVAIRLHQQGHLFVYAHEGLHDSSIIAVFAPGEWSSVVIGDGNDR